MRYRSFMRRAVDESLPEVLAFGPEHYREAGVGFSPGAGMPMLEAYQLVNKWNGAQHDPRFIFWLEAA